jgi:hypothetical protein
MTQTSRPSSTAKGAAGVAQAKDKASDSTEPTNLDAHDSLPERRRHARYRFSEPMTVRRPDGVSLDGMSVEMSEGGMSAIIKGSLRAGDVVQIQPVTGVTTSALVRHKLGMLYGLEFLGLDNDQLGKIAERCRKCEPWRARTRAV